MPKKPYARHASVPYVAPFGAFMLCIALQKWLPTPEIVAIPLQLALLGAVIYAFSWEIVDLHASRVLQSALLGVGVFVIWILPDVLFPHYREHWMLQNAFTGFAKSSLSSDGVKSPAVWVLRSLRAVMFVPLLEELFWRGWLMRWLISPRFERIPLGTYAAQSFWLTAVLFASEHGPYWDVGLVTGVVYNFWLMKTRRLGDCILAHAVTNACLAGYVVATHRWEYWL